MMKNNERPGRRRDRRILHSYGYRDTQILLTLSRQCDIFRQVNSSTVPFWPTSSESAAPWG